MPFRVTPEFVQHLLEQNAQLTAQVMELTAQIAELTARVAELQQTIQKLLEKKNIEEGERNDGQS